MRATLKGLVGQGRGLLVGVLAIGALAVSGAPALAAPGWGITMEDHNAYGLQSAQCKSKGPEPTAKPPCGVDPLTEAELGDTGMTFARESGDNAYAIKVENKGPGAAGSPYQAGETLNCAGRPLSGASAAYRWLRDGTEITGATAQTYTLSPEDNEKAIECQVIATNASEKVATVAVSSDVQVSPVPATPPPSEAKEVELVPNGKQPVGTVVTCAAGTWTSVTTPVFKYEWLRNGVPITPATKEMTEGKYPLRAEDEGTAIQCRVTATNGGGSAVAVTSSKEVATAGEVEGEPNFPKAEAAIPVATVVDRLPKGIVLTSDADQGLLLSANWTCTILPGRFQGKEFEGPSEFSCFTTKALAASQKYTELTATVEVMPSAESRSVNEVTVSGVGTTTTEAHGETTITSAVPFGINCLSVNILEEPITEKRPCEEGKAREEAKNQAGGHPFSVTTEFALNYTTSSYEGTFNEPRLVTAGGGPKEIEAELPPGFVGNPQNIPECPFAVLEVNGCPEDTAVGYTETSYSTAQVKKGIAEPFFIPVHPGEHSKSKSLVYNLQPDPGQPAAFGFVIIGRVPFVLEAKVRSDGDYGVTVGDSAVAEKVLGDKATFCEYGAQEVKEQLSCRAELEAQPGSKPFLTNPTSCSSEPHWTLRTAPWEDPANSVSRELATGPVTGCELLKESFQPQIKFTPSPASEGGTSEADAPTGLTFALNLPQTDDPSKLGTPDLKGIKMTLPEGLTISPSAAGGLEACSNAQFGLGTEFGPGAPKLVPEPPAKAASCPAASQVGTVEVFTPLLSGAPAIEGAAPSENEHHQVPNVNTRLTCSQGMWSGGPWSRSAVQHEAGVEELENSSEERLKLHYQWLLQGGAIPGATERVYAFTREIYEGKGKPGEGDKEKPMQCQVTAVSAAGSAVAVSKDVVVAPEPSPVPPFPPPSIAKPSGTPAVGNTLTCAAGTWTISPAKVKFVDGILAAGSLVVKSKTAAFSASDLERVITFETSVQEKTKAGPREVKTAKITAVLSSEEVTVEVKEVENPEGWAKEVKAVDFSLERAPASTLTYSWLRNGVAINGASGEGHEKYALTSEDEGKVVQCQVAAANQGARKNEKGEVVIEGGGVVVADSPAVVVSPEPSTVLPLPGAPVQGQLFVAAPECSPCTNQDAEDGKLFRLFLQIQDPGAGVIIKLHGITRPNTVTGRLETEFVEQPQQPFELLDLRLKGGARATLANPQTCGLATTTADLTPWSTPFTPDASVESSFNVEGCGASLFNPSFNAGTTGPSAAVADASPSFSLTFSRQDREQDLSGVQVHMPPGLVGKIAGIPLCGEAQAIAGTCGPASQIGTALAGAGPGPDPYFEEGKVYLTGPTTLKNGLHGPFGLSVVTPATSKAFNLGNVVVRSVIDIDPNTAAVTATSEPLPQIIDGVPLRVRTVNVSLNRPGFMLNPTNCSPQQISATLTSAQGAAAQVASPYGLAGCKSLPFAPRFSASTQAQTSKTNGASLDVKVTYPPGAYANIAKTVTELPTALPSRLTTLQKACADKVFEANPATCPEGSMVGYATARTPLLNVPLSGPAILVSHGSAAFPDLEILLQGEGVEVILDGQTDIKKGITKTTFNAVPDSPVETFELNLPEGPHSALGANVAPCSTPLELPTTLTGQNGAVIKQETKIAVIGCPPTVAIAKRTLSGNSLLVTVTTSSKGTVTISGRGLKTAKFKNLNAGTHRLKVALSKAGRSLRRHRTKVTVRVSLTAATTVVAKATTVRL